MTIYRRWSTSLSSAIWLVFALAMWIAFAPVALGGNAAYAIVNGISMEPNFHLGDLVIVSPSSYYEVGDIVVYQNQGLGGSEVFHRIIEQNLEHYILKGDNNSWIDTYQPTREEIIGKLWIYIPGGGRFMEKVRTPTGMAIVAGALGLFIASGFFPDRKKGKKQMNQNSILEWGTSIAEKVGAFFSQRLQTNPDPSKKPQQHPPGSESSSEFLFLSLGVITLASLFLAIVSFSRTAFHTVTDNFSYEHLGIFSYSATAPQGVYDSDIVKSGDPIFPKLTCKVDVNFQYVLIAKKVENFVGTYQLTATITDPASGWKRSIPLQEITPFGETPVTTNTQLDLCEISSIVESFEENSSVRPGTYELKITPQIAMSAKIEGSELQDNFNKGLKFRYDHIQYYVIDNGKDDPFNPIESGTVGKERKEANVLSLLGLKLQIPALRIFSLIGLIGGLAGIIFLWQSLQRLSERNYAEFIRTKFGSILVDVQKTKLGSSKSLVDVSSIDDLAKLAERHDTMILHEKQGNSHIYYVQGEISTYRFVLNIEDLNESGIL